MKVYCFWFFFLLSGFHFCLSLLDSLKVYPLKFLRGMNSDDNNRPTVTTKVGVIRGVRASDGDYDMFMGIPYAKVSEENPFGEVQPQPVFEGIFDADDDSAASPQREELHHSIIGTLDSLHVNIYVPHSETPLPIMVWIFGSMYVMGFPGRFMFGPKYFMEHGVVLVTLNYRLGLYGFLCMDTPEIPGNQGFKDILAALRWIKRNLLEFGGDVNNITVFGESTGATVIDLFLTLEEELFHKAILMSGSIIRPVAFRDSDKSMPLRLAEKLGFKTDDPKEALQFLAKADPHLVIKASVEMGLDFRPCIEKKFDGIENVITDCPRKLKLKKLKEIPIMLGYCNAETLFRYFRKNANFMKSDVFNVYMDSTFDLVGLEDVKKIVRHYYLDNKEYSKETSWQIMEFDSDFNFVHPLQRRIQDLKENGAKVYQYLFSYCGERNFVKKKYSITEEGANHADDIAYLFDLSFEKTPSEMDQLTIDRMTTLWTNFAKYGEPTPSPSSLLPVKFSPVTKHSSPCFVIDKTLSTTSRPFHDRMAFWDLFYNAYGHRLKD